MEQQQPQKEVAPLRPRVANACEACRFAKVKCQESSQVGICKRNADQNSTTTTSKTNSNSKTSTTAKTTSKTSNPSSLQKQSSLSSPPPGPSRTFTIDVPIPTASVDIAISLESLRLNHEGFMDHICPDLNTGIDSEGDDGTHDCDYDYGSDGEPVGSVVSSHASHASSLPVGASAATPESSSTSASGGGFRSGKGNTRMAGQGAGLGLGGSSRSLASLSVQPQFNVDSASRLLDTFRNVMLWHFPCVLIDHVVYNNNEKEEVKAELEEATVASLARERPFVLLAVLAAASSTRTLQGHSLYDEEFRKILGLKFVAGGERSLELLQGLAVYVACFATSWNRTPSMSFTSYTSKCCDILEKYSITKGDRILPWLVRLQQLCEETNDLRKPQRGAGGLPQATESQIEMIIKGMEAQLNEWQVKMPSDLQSIPSIRITTLFTRLFLTGAPLLKKRPPSFRVDGSRLLNLIPTLHQNYEYFLSLSAHEINAFSMIGWGCLILSTILGFRMSFPIMFCPEWDDYAARRVVKFGGFLDRLCRLGTCISSTSEKMDKDGRNGLTPAAIPTTKGMDVLSASKVVFAVVNRKFKNRVARMEGAGMGKGKNRDTRMGDVGVVVGQQHDQHRHLQTPTLPTQSTTTRHHHPQHSQSQQEALEVDICMDLSCSMLPLEIDSLQGQAPMPTLHIPSTNVSGCPMMDGSLEPYYPYWNETFAFNSTLTGFGGSPSVNSLGSSGSSGSIDTTRNEIASEQQISVEGSGNVPPGAMPGMGSGTGGMTMNMGMGTGMGMGYNDLWAAMTMDWAADGGVEDWT
ncbi:hypothetical protein NEUTE2DRAFT_153444 [Neurospora tetrasperma FGSC 2509]|nr:hypothetical protein NEUTE2DRAFT_153444 [Neurospora tetrasperma FGSC 2509]